MCCIQQYPLHRDIPAIVCCLLNRSLSYYCDDGWSATSVLLSEIVLGALLARIKARKCVLEYTQLSGLALVVDASTIRHVAFV
jgi:hypothetical protein